MPINDACFAGLDLKSSTFVDVFRRRAKEQPHKVACTFLVDGETEEVSVTYGELDRQARSIAVKLQLLGVSGQPALLLYPYGLEFIAAFLGCLYGGVIAVPASPPLSPRYGRTIFRITGIVNDAKPAAVLTTSAIKGKIEALFAQTPDIRPMRFLATDQVAMYLSEEWKSLPATSTTAFLQYTSGSTVAPRGVMVSHQNLAQNSNLIRQCFEHSPQSKGVIWLPPYHDMGLIGGILQPLYSGFPVTLMSPVAFLQRPFRWLQAITRFKGTTSGGPDFAYDLCVQKITAEQKATLDLSSWDVAFNGAEPINADTLELFASHFESCGFRREAFYPCYGLAEATLIVSGGSKSSPPVYRSFQASAIKRNEVVEDTSGREEVKTLVGCGRVVSGQKVIIVDPETLTECSPNRIGEIWVSGTSVAQGYWKRPEETEQTFHAYLADTKEGPFLRTGDLGCIYDGELFVTGRLKDLIIIDGSNHYALDIERTVGRSHPALRRGSYAAFSIDLAGKEQLVIIAELERRYYSNLHREDKSVPSSLEYEQSISPYTSEVIEAIRTAVAEDHELPVYDILIVKLGAIPKTSSGKLQRYACKTGYLARSLGASEE